MATIRSFEDVDSWQMARSFSNSIYTISNTGAFARDFGLRDQMRRAAVSIMANIAEGFERNGNREFVHFLSVAKGSAGECRSLLYVAADRGYISSDQFSSLLGECRAISAKIQSFIEYLQRSELKGTNLHAPA